MKKSMILFGMLLMLSYGCNKRDGKLSGVVTYYFNENYGDKPDVGAKIYIINRDSAKVNFIKQFVKDKRSIDIGESYQGLKETKKSLIESYKSSLNKPYYSKIEKEEFRKKIEELEMEITQIPNIDTSFTRGFEVTADSAFRQIYFLQSNSKVFIADGAGAYSSNLKPGNYYVLIVSNHREGRTLADYDGQIAFSSVVIESDKETTANAQFTID